MCVVPRDTHSDHQCSNRTITCIMSNITVIVLLILDIPLGSVNYLLFSPSVFVCVFNILLLFAIIYKDGGDWILEEVEETKPLTTLLNSTPTVDQLCSRLKPKMIQDPLQGDHLNHSYIFKYVHTSDILFTL